MSYICYYLVVDRSRSRSGPTAATTRSRLKTLEMRQRKAFKGGHLHERKLCPVEGVDHILHGCSTRFRVYYPPVGDDTRHSEKKQ